MSYRHFALLSLSLLLVACGGGTEDGDSVLTTQRDPMTGIDQNAAGIDGVSGTALPGSAQDLVENVGDRVFFGYDSFDLSGEARATLERQAQWLNQYGSLSVTVEGHADERGTREYNLALGERRANAVRNYLVALGVDASRINVVSFGKERPEVFGSDAQSWAQNRRGVTVIN